jgi:hypothetical protein
MVLLPRNVKKVWNYYSVTGTCEHRDFKGTVSRDFLLHESVSPQPQSIPLRPFRIFLKICGDILSLRFATGVNDTGGKWQKSSIRKFLIILFGHLWVVEETYI